MKYAELTKAEQTCARVQMLDAMNDMEMAQAADVGKAPQMYSMTSPLFKAMLKEAEFDRWIDADGAQRLTLNQS